MVTTFTTRVTPPIALCAFCYVYSHAFIPLITVDSRLIIRLLFGWLRCCCWLCYVVVPDVTLPARFPTTPHPRFPRSLFIVWRAFACVIYPVYVLAALLRFPHATFLCLYCLTFPFRCAVDWFIVVLVPVLAVRFPVCV